LPFDVTTFPATDPIAVALGAKKLDAEDSINYSIGAVLRFGQVDITIDAYRIDIDNRIVLSENLTSAAVRTYLATQGFIGAGGGRFFINGVDTQTQGVDVVLNWPFETGAGRFDFTFTANFNQTDVTSVPSTPQLAALNPPPVLFDRFNILTFEEGTPDSKLTAQVNWNFDRWGATLRGTHYGWLSPDSALSRSRRLPRERYRMTSRWMPRRWSTSRAASTSRRASASRSARRICSTSIRPEHAARQPDRDDVVLELLAVRAIRKVRVRKAQLQVPRTIESPRQPQHTPSRRLCCG
jgi:outer membrane receptor protein involved in Fe transport